MGKEQSRLVIGSSKFHVRDGFAKADQDGPGGFGCRVILGTACRERGASPGKRSDFVDMEMHGRQRIHRAAYSPAVNV